MVIDPTASDAECTIIINAKKPNYILAATNPDLIYISSDTGATWTQANLSTFASTTIAGDITLTADTAGHFFYQAFDGQNVFHTLRSDNYGSTWGTESVFGIANCLEDKSWLACDKTTSPYNGRVYSAWTFRNAFGCSNESFLFVQSSNDAGQTWSPRDTLAVDTSYVPPIGAGISVGPNGVVGVTWCGGEVNRIRFRKSTDGGNTWGNTVVVDSNVQPVTNFADIIDHSAGFASAFTSLSYDNSTGPYNGNLYCVWSDLRNGANDADIFLARSTNGGSTWVTQRINNDATTRNQIFPTVTVDPVTGWVYVAYLDARLNTDNFDDTLHYYLAWSNNGGASFNNVQVSQQASTVSWMHSDYMGADAYNGNVHLVWVGGTSGTGRVMTAKISQSQLMVSVPEITSAYLSSFIIRPNPSPGSLGVDFQLSDPSSVSIKIMDPLGRPVMTVKENENYEAGYHHLNLDGSSVLSAGAYYMNISGSGNSITRKFVIIK